MPAHWTTAVSPNGWTDAVLGSAWLQINFEPYTRPQSNSEWRSLILDGHDPHITWQFIHFALALRIICVCLPPHSTHLLQPLDELECSHYLLLSIAKAIQLEANRRL